MNDKRADIQLIQKYLNGELDAKAMHQLEREAQGDPFLADALEGYGHTTENQQGSLEALQLRLQGRTAAKTRHIIPWAVISIAASVIVFAVVVGLLYKSNKPQSQQIAKVAINQSPKNAAADTATGISDKKSIQTILDTPQGRIAYNQPKHFKSYAHATDANQYDAPATVNEAGAEQMDVLKKTPDSSSAMEDKIMGYMAAKRQDTVLGGGNVETTNNAAALTVLNSKVKGADMTVRPGSPNDNNAYTLNKVGLPANLVTGVVLSRVDGLPLPGASVRVVGKPIATQTDANGKFTLPNVKKDESLAIGYIGYTSKTLGVKGADSLKVELDESNKALSEVVVAPVSRKKAKAAKARPQAGWDALKEYFRENAVSPDGKEGKVELAFTVNANGSITDINVTKSLSKAADDKAISLLKDGPTWSGNTNGKAEEIKVKVEFHK